MPGFASSGSIKDICEDQGRRCSCMRVVRALSKDVESIYVASVASSIGSIFFRLSGIDPGSKSCSAAVPCQGLVCYPFGGNQGGGQASNSIQNNSGLPQGAGRPAAGWRCGASDSAGRPSERKFLHSLSGTSAGALGHRRGHGECLDNRCKGRRNVCSKTPICGE